MSFRRGGAKRRRDANEGAIVAALEAVGAEVFYLSGCGVPDLLVAFKGCWMPLEVKTATGGLKRSQKEWTARRTAIPIVRSVDEALRAVVAVTNPLHICGQPRFDPQFHHCLGCHPKQ
jgi:hypothetical protein